MNKTLLDLDFKAAVAKLGDRDLRALVEFAAEQAFEARKEIALVADIADCNRRRIDKIVKNQNKVLGIFAGIGAVIGAATAAILTWLLNR